MTRILNPASYQYQGLQKLPSPIILDDSLELAEVEALSIASESGNGSLAKRYDQGALLSMSGYEKPQIPDIKEYDASRSLHDPMYLAHAPPSFTQPHVRSPSSPYARHQVPYVANNLLQPRSIFENSQSPFSGIPSHQIPEVSNYTPQQGPQGTTVFVYFMSAYDLTTAPNATYYAMFATGSCPAVVTMTDHRGPYYNYILTAEAPPYSATGWASPSVPLRIHVHNGAGLDVGSVAVGHYTYTDVMQQPSQSSAQEGSRKRKVSIESAETARIPAKRSSTQQLRSDGEGTYGAQIYAQQPSPVDISQQPTLALDSSYGSLVPYSRSPHQEYYQQQRSPRRISHHLSTSSASSHSHLRGPSPQPPSWSPLLATASQATRSPNLSTSTGTRISSISSPSITAHPPLIRTSTLQQSPSPAANPLDPSTGGSFNPAYKSYPHKAVLKINGDLNTMVEDWTENEGEAKRRLVQFWRSQSNNTITTNFKPVAAEDRQPNSTCISCIWWEAKQECFVTSVDTIYLLESLVALRFTVEEKNRIRRNLEGFRPMTVSKGKSDSEDFFKLIMGFPSPKPRNIEKDVKVFPWNILTHALKKIIGKYSASYSSAAGELHNLGHSSYGGVAQSDAGNDLLPTASTHSASMPIGRGAYATALTSAMIPPTISHDRSSNPYSSAGSSMLQVTHNYSTQPLSYQYQSQAQAQMQSPGTIQSMQVPHQGPWDFPTYLEASPATATPSNAQAVYYQSDGTSLAAPQDASTTRYQVTHASSGP